MSSPSSSRRKRSREPNVVTLIYCRLPQRKVKLGWISLKPSDGSISFGMADNAYVAPYIGANLGLWNLYNQVAIEYVVTADRTAMRTVKNPHFTYHPKTLTFHLKESDGVKEDASFSAVTRLEMTVAQQGGEIPWIRATSSPLVSMKTAGTGRHGASSERAIIIDAPSEDASITMCVDLALHGIYRIDSDQHWFLTANTMTMKVTVFPVAPQTATLNWVHFC